jgi:hypothetical protein
VFSAQCTAQFSVGRFVQDLWIATLVECLFCVFFVFFCCVSSAEQRAKQDNNFAHSFPVFLFGKQSILFACSSQQPIVLTKLHANFPFFFLSGAPPWTPQPEWPTSQT